MSRNTGQHSNSDSTPFSFPDQNNKFSTDLIFRIGTRTATITAVYERVPARELPSPPSVIVTPPIPTIRSQITPIYEEPKSSKTIFYKKSKK